jgi:hypothetical protein
VVNDAKVTITREGAGFTAIIDLLPGSLSFGCSVMLNAHGQSAEEAECRARVLLCPPALGARTANRAPFLRSKHDY